MKLKSFLSIALASFTAVSCGVLDNFNKPLNDDVPDPLATPFTKKKSKTKSSSEAETKKVEVSPYSVGEFVETSIPNAAFFKEIPKGDAMADRILPVATPVKYVSKKGKYIRAELENGQVGYIPTIMIAKKGTTFVRKETVVPENQLLKRIEKEKVLENDLKQEIPQTPELAVPEIKKEVVAPVQEQLKKVEQAVQSIQPRTDGLIVPENQDGTISQDSSLE